MSISIHSPIRFACRPFVSHTMHHAPSAFFFSLVGRKEGTVLYATHAMHPLLLCFFWTRTYIHRLSQLVLSTYATSRLTGRPFRIVSRHAPLITPHSISSGSVSVVSCRCFSTQMSSVVRSLLFFFLCDCRGCWLMVVIGVGVVVVSGVVGRWLLVVVDECKLETIISCSCHESESRYIQYDINVAFCVVDHGDSDTNAMQPHMNQHPFISQPNASHYVPRFSFVLLLRVTHSDALIDIAIETQPNAAGRRHEADDRSCSTLQLSISMTQSVALKFEGREGGKFASEEGMRERGGHVARDPRGLNWV